MNNDYAFGSDVVDMDEQNGLFNKSIEESEEKVFISQQLKHFLTENRAGVLLMEIIDNTHQSHIDALCSVDVVDTAALMKCKIDYEATLKLKESIASIIAAGIDAATTLKTQQ